MMMIDDALIEKKNSKILNFLKKKKKRFINNIIKKFQRMDVVILYT
jgi:hypothetical protein